MIEILINIYLFWSITCLFKTIENECDKFYPLSPKYLYEKTNMNMFGCYVYCIVLVLLSPIYPIGRVIYCFVY